MLAEVIQFEDKGDSSIDWMQLFKELKYYVYLLSWAIKFYFYLKIRQMKSTKVINTFIVGKLELQRKIHFLVYNINVVDISFVGTRALLHSKYSRDFAFYIFFTLFLYCLAILDTVLVFYDSANLVYATHKAMVQQKKKKELEGPTSPIDKTKKTNSPETMKALNVASSSTQGSEMSDNSKQLKFNEKKQSFRHLVKGDLGLRDWFWEEDMVKMDAMTPAVAKRIGYVRVADFDTCIRHIELNEAVFAHATSELKPNEKVFSYKSVLLANFAFILRVVSYHMIMVAFSNTAFMQVILLITVEVSYSVLILKNFILLRYLLSLHMFLSKIVQSLILLTFHVITFMILMRNGPNSIKSPSKGRQKALVYTIIVAIIMEYIFLICNVVWIIKQAINDRKKKKTEKNKKDTHIRWKWVRSSKFNAEARLLSTEFTSSNKISHHHSYKSSLSKGKNTVKSVP